MAKKNQRLKSYQGVIRYVLLLTLVLWFGAMALLTWAVAVDFRDQLRENARNVVHSGGPKTFRFQNDRICQEDESLPGYREYSIIRYMGVPYVQLETDNLFVLVPREVPFSGHSSDDWSYGMWDLLYGFEYAISYENPQTDIQMKSGNYYSFSYTTEDGWKEEELRPLGWGYIDLDLVDNGESVLNQYVLYSDDGDKGFSMLWSRPLKMTGYFEKNQFVPQQVWVGNPGENQESFRMNDMERAHAADQKGLVIWELILDEAEATGTGGTSGELSRDYETIYLWNSDGFHVELEPLRVGGRRYEDLNELLESRAMEDGKYTWEEHNGLWRSVFVYRTHVTDEGEEYVYGLAVQGWPISYAMARMWPLYLASMAAALLVMWLILRVLMKHLTMPLERMAYGIENGTTVVSRDTDWQEPYVVAEHLAETKRTMAEEAAKLQQTQTALSYAKNAEEYRRQLISNITHELKTPLAVIHSYTECLREGRAEEKKDHYLDVILTESERMDAMVLQMLDLSRLEAGKVKLTMDHFSLVKLVRSVTDKFVPLLEQKELELTYTKMQEFLITADESRIEQVVTNLVSNAFHYTNPGGKIQVQVCVYQHSALLIVENTAPPLSDEALEKVWDSFYRADASRTDKGTGLGLALVKQIVELHGGRCQVENIEKRAGEKKTNWISFRIYIPLQ